MYTVENLLVIEDLEAQRKQTIIALPEHISVIQMAKDNRFLAVGSATVNDEKKLANIYIVDTFKRKFTITKTLSFHQKGIQSLQFSPSGKHLVSIGNLKECTVAVWDWQNGKLLASSYTLDKITDLKISTRVFTQDRLLEFVTVGRDQVQFWALNREHKLQYYDIFLEKINQKIPEITAVDYLDLPAKQLIAVGL